MKKIIAAGAAAVMLAFSGTAAYAAYEPTTTTDVKPKSQSGKIKPGDREKIKVEQRVAGDDAQCTGTIVIFYRGDENEILRQREKDAEADGNVLFNGKVPGGTESIVILYQRGPKDPCDKSKFVIRL